MIPSLAPVIVRATKNGSHNADNYYHRIKIWGGVPAFAAVLAQERYEWALKWRCLFIVGTLIGVPLAYIVHPFAGAVGFLLSALLTRIPAFSRWMELRGHAIECAVAAKFYGMDLDAYEYRESLAMWNGYDGLFKHMEHEELLFALEDRHPWADRWADRHASMIRKDMERVDD